MEYEKIKKITKWMALSKHPRSIWLIEQSIRTIDIIRCEKLEITELKDDLCKEINKCEQKIHDYYVFKNKAWKNYSSKITDKKIEIHDNIDLEDYEGIIDEFLEPSNKGLYNNEDINNNYKDNEYIQPRYVDPININLNLITKDSEILTELFPKSFQCKKCDYYFLFDKEYGGDLNCLNCKEPIIQVPLIFSCPHCANTEELIPWYYDKRDLHNYLFKCSAPGCKGNLTLKISVKNLFNSKWVCDICGTNYKNAVYEYYKDPRLVRYCKCSIRTKDDSRRVYRMQLRPSSSRIFHPLSKSYIYVRDQEISLEILKEEAKRYKNLDPLNYWDLNQLDSASLKLLQSLYNLYNVFIVDDVTSYTCIYGYISSLSEKNLLTEQKLPQTFKNMRKHGKWEVYLIRTEGKGLVLELNKDKIIENAEIDMSYNELIDNTINIIKNSPIQDILNPNFQELNNLDVIKGLHSIMHSFLSLSNLEIGINIFGSKLLLKDCAILLYERERISSGGITQLTLGASYRNRFFNIAKQVSEKLENCIHDCNSACPSCNFIEDFSCQPYLVEEIDIWMPPNSLLDRKMGYKLYHIV